MSIHDVLRKQKYGPRQLPFSPNHEGPVTIPGLGAFAFVSVGSTAYTTGIDVFFHPEGDEECAKGHLRFHAQIGKDLRLKWILDHDKLDYGDYDGARFGACVYETAIEQLNNLHMRAPTSWGFHVGDAAAMEFRILRRKLDDLTSSVSYISEMLKRPPQNGRTPEEIRAQLARRQAQLASFRTHKTQRMDDLKRVINIWHDWSSAKTSREPIATAFGRALDLTPAEPVLLCA
jgi:hypothetical protein